jgi:conjugal transfer mating pair stabilization protein TraG
VQAATERYGEAIGDLATYQLQTLPPAALTEVQEVFYRGQLDNALFAHGPLGFLQLTSPAQQAAHDRLMEAHGPVLGGAIAEQLTQAAHSLDNGKLTGVIAYNRAQADIARLEERAQASSVQSLSTDGPGQLIHDSTSAGTPGRVLDLIAAPESRGNYNALYKDADQQAIELSGLALDEVRGLQQRLVAERGGSPVGRYQIIDDTLENLMQRMGLSGQERFTPELQDRMGLLLARDAGLDAWQSGRLSSATFAHNLSRVWAGLPADDSNRSYYEGVAGNRARIGWTTVLAALDTERPAR